MKDIMTIRKKNKYRVAILFGGQSNEHEISLLSSINIINAIDRTKYDLILIGIDKHGRWILYHEPENYLLNSDDPKSICLAPNYYCYLAIVPGKSGIKFIDTNNCRPLPAIDVVFSVLHGANGENGSVQGLLQVLNIPYVGSDVLSSALCMNKDMTKRILRDAGIPVTPSITLLRYDNSKINVNEIIDQLGLPLFIKPINQGSSIGVSKITNYFDFKEALALAFNFDDKILVEQGISGREIEIAVLGSNHPEISVCGEIISNEKFYTYHSKYIKDNQAKLIIPATLSQSIIDDIQHVARRAYLALGCSIMARIDLFLTDQNQILINEVNTLPGFTSISMYPKLWKASGLDYSTLIDRLITLAILRQC